MTPRLLVAAIYAFAPGLVASTNLHDQIYTPLGVNAVSRLLDSTRQIGASTPADGAIGALYQIDTEAKFTEFAAAGGDAYVALISTSMLANKTAVKTMLGLDKLKGMLLYDDGAMTPFSADDMDYKGTTINPTGGGFGADDQTGLHWIDITVPLFTLTDADKATVLAKYAATKDINAPSRETLGVRMKFFQWAVTNSMVCLRRSHQGSKFCQPLGGHNVGGALKPIEDHTGTRSSNKSIIVVATQMDAVSLFHDNAWGGGASAAALAGFTALAKMVVDNKTPAEREAATTNIVFMAFQGEQFKNIGSSRFMKNIQASSFDDLGTFGQLNSPCTAADGTNCNIKAWIEFSQMLLTDGAGVPTTRVHYNSSESNAACSTDAGVPVSCGAQLENDGLTAASSTSMLPKSSIAALREWGGDAWAKIDAVVVGDFDDGWSNVTDSSHSSNRYRYTRQDNAESLGITNETTEDDMLHLCQSVCAIAKTLQTKAFGSTDLSCNDGEAEIETCKTYTWEFLHAMLVDQYARVNISDTAAIQVARPEDSPDAAATPINRYTSVFQSKSYDVVEAFMYWHLSAALAHNTTTPTTGCPGGVGSTAWHTVPTQNPGGVAQACFNTTTFYLEAKSPAFSEDQTSVVDSRFSTWTEATWNEGSIDIFLLNDDAEGSMMLGVGLGYIVVCIAVVRHLTSAISQTAAAAAGPTSE